MMTSYEVGAVFRIADQASPTLLKLATELDRLEKLALGVRKAFEGLGKLKIPGVTGSMDKLSRELTLVTDKAVLAERALGGIGKTGTVIGGAAREAGLLQRELAAAVKEGNALSRIKPPNFNPGGGGGGRHPRPGQNGGHGAHRAGEVGLQLGIFGGIGAHEVGHFLKHALKDAGELEHVRQQMYLGGLDRDIHTGQKGQVNKATAAAWREATKYGLPVAGILGDIKELALPFGSVDHAIEFIEPLEKMKIVLNAMSEGKGSEAREAVYKMARAGELKGLTEAKDFNSYFDSMTKAITASGGKITPNGFAQVTQYGKLASFGWNEEFYTKYLPTLMQTMNPSTAGQSLMSLFQMSTGVVKGDSARLMMEMGLLKNDEKLLKRDKKGKLTGFHKGALIGDDVLTHNPFEYARDFLLPKLEKKFGDLNIAENKEKAIGFMGEIYGNRNTAAAMAELALRMKSFERDHAMIGQAQGTSAATGLADKDPVTAMNRLKGAWENFMTMLGGPGVAAAISSINALATGLTVLTRWGNDHPEAMKTVLGALAGLGAALTALAVAGVIAGAVLLGPGGAVAVAVTTLIGVISGIAAVNWDAVKGGFKTAMDYMKSWYDWLAKIGDRIGGNKPASGPGEGLIPQFIPQSYDGPAFGGGAGIVKASFSTGGEFQSGSGDERFAKCVYVGVLAALRDFGGGGGGGGGFGGAGFHRASLGGGGGFTAGFGGGGSWNGKALPVGAGTGLGHTASQSERAAYIRAQAAALGMDPEVALRVAQSEGFNQYVGDQGRSFGDWQLFTGGGLGNAALAAGINIRDPRTWKAQTDFALRYAKQHGWGSWYGAGRVGIGNHVGIDGVAGVVNGDLRVKGGPNGQAFGGGGMAPGLLAFAEQLQRGGGVNRFTAFNDRFHAGTGSMHARGLATDVTGDPDKIMANARAMMEAAGLQEGRDFKMIDEYRGRSKRWTGGHVHFQFETPEAAAAYAAAQRRSVPPTAGAPPKPQHDKVVSIPVHIGGHKVAHVMHRVMTAHATFPTSAGNMDSHGQYRSPGTTLTDTA